MYAMCGDRCSEYIRNYSRVRSRFVRSTNGLVNEQSVACNPGVNTPRKCYDFTGYLCKCSYTRTNVRMRLTRGSYQARKVNNLR